MHTDRPFNACPIEFAHTRADFWRAKLLHVRKGGGWRRLMKLGDSRRRVSLHHRGSGGGRALGASAHVGRARGAGRLRVLSGRSRCGRSSVTTGRCASTSARRDSTWWTRLRKAGAAGTSWPAIWRAGIIYLLYLNPRLYRIVPKRALGNRSDEFERLLQAALPTFDYRRRYPVADTARI